MIEFRAYEQQDIYKFEKLFVCDNIFVKLNFTIFQKDPTDSLNRFIIYNSLKKILMIQIFLLQKPVFQPNLCHLRFFQILFIHYVFNCYKIIERNEIIFFVKVEFKYNQPNLN